MAIEFFEIVCVIFAPIVTYVLYLILFAILHFRRVYLERQKTRSPQERRMYAGGARSRPSSFAPQEPTIYVSPNNLPPPPKYECMAPPSYEEAVGVHTYPQLQQPITTPITTAMRTERETRNNATTSNSPSTVVNVSGSERRTSITVGSST